MDGRTLPVPVGPTGNPPKTYRIPVPDAAGGPPTVLVYRREPRAYGKRLGLVRGWKYVHDPVGGPTGLRARLPWGKPPGGASGKPGDPQD